MNQHVGGMSRLGFLSPRAALRSLALVAFLAVTASAAAADPELEKRPAEEVQDNSFLVEEAYNQEAGVVQHILSLTHTINRVRGPDERAWSFNFTQEWPAFSQAHQLSYTVPYSFVSDGGRWNNGVEDVLLNYRWQALMESDRTLAFAPRLSLILPTGDAAEGFGDDTIGGQVNLPVSKIVSARWTLHGNAGATLLPGVRGHNLVSYNLGASAIYAVAPSFNLMLETIANWDEAVDDRGRTERLVSAYVSPGFRYAFNHPGDAQTVLGLAAPLGVTSGSADYGVILYASFEHFFHRAKPR